MEYPRIRGLVAVALFSCGVGVAHASVVWDWSGNSGQEFGTFTTDGNLVGGALPAGTYNVTDFSLGGTSFSDLTSLIGGSISGGEFAAGAPVDGFVWDGSMITEFFRSSGASTNGATILSTGGPFGPYDQAWWVFDVGGVLVIGDPGDSNPSTTFNDQVTAPRLPEPATALLLGLGMLGLGWSRRPKR